MIIAVDGTLASGKGTIARALAAHYNLPYMDTGRLYRSCAWAALQAGVCLDNVSALVELAYSMTPEAYDEADLRTEAVGDAASKLAVLSELRAALVKRQRDFATQPGGAILDGRDIGTVICPDADVKLWIDADIEVRARRRAADYAGAGQTVSESDMIAKLKARDDRDKARATAPMKKSENAVLIDTSKLSIDEAVERARGIIDASQAQKDSSL